MPRPSLTGASSSTTGGILLVRQDLLGRHAEQHQFTNLDRLRHDVTVVVLGELIDDLDVLVHDVFRGGVTREMIKTLLLVTIFVAVIVRLTTAWAIPGWATYTVGILLILLVQAVMAAFVFSFMILGARHGSPFLPRRDYSFFIGTVQTLQGPQRSVTPLSIREWAGEVHG